MAALTALAVGASCFEGEGLLWLELPDLRSPCRALKAFDGVSRWGTGSRPSSSSSPSDSTAPSNFLRAETALTGVAAVGTCVSCKVLMLDVFGVG